jgi:CheY-like chemotaxis protein
MALILLVDDLPEITELIKITLEDEHLVLETHDGVAALRMVQRVRPNLVILDIHLNGGMDGLAVCQELRATPALADVPILAISGVPNIEDVSDIMKAGANSFLSKPYTPRDLIEMVNRLIGSEVTRLTRLLKAIGEQDIVDSVKEAIVTGSSIKIIRALKQAITEAQQDLKEAGA